jgi:hypothetical protein
MISESDTDAHLAEVLEILKQQFESGNKAALLESIYQCTLMSRPLPEWLRDAFVRHTKLGPVLKSGHGMKFSTHRHARGSTWKRSKSTTYGAVTSWSACAS